jgi:hypothetical protein
MNADLLIPKLALREPFRRDRYRFVADRSGCYVLTTFSGEILYIGLSNNLRRRLEEHLDNPQKTAPTSFGRAVFFHWLETPDLQKVERTWLGAYQITEGRLPILNAMFSPVST